MALPRRLPRLPATARGRELVPRQLVTPPTPEEPPGLDERGADIAALLDAAENVVNEAGTRIRAEVEADRARGRGGRLSRWLRRRGG